MKTLSLALFLILAVGGNAAFAGTSIDERRPAEPDGKVVIENLGGSVVVKGWDKKEVTITGTLADDAERLEIDEMDDRITIAVVFPEGKRNLHDTESDLEITVPHKSRVRVGAVNASIEASGVDGSLALETVNGSITASGDPSTIEASTVNGSIHIESSASDVEAESVNGTITLQGVQGDVSANTVSGAIEVIGGKFDEVDCSTISGEIRFDGAPSKTCSIDIECHSGAVILMLPDDVSAEFDVETFSGSIFNDFGPEARRTSEYAPGKELSFSTGSGDARISVSSFSGSIRLEKK